VATRRKKNPAEKYRFSARGGTEGMRVLRAAVLLIAWTSPVHGDVDIGEKATVYPVAKHGQNSTVKKGHALQDHERSLLA
jgi:hypothetical protein